MQTNAVPVTDTSINTTGCCPQFNPVGWDGQDLHFRDKRFVRAHTASVAHVPLNMGKVFARVLGHIEARHAADPAQSLTLSRELSPWAAEHLFAVTGDVPEEEEVTLSGDYLTSVFEGPFSAVKGWHEEMRQAATRAGHRPGPAWFYYTTCPKCAKVYGRNPVVGVVELLPLSAA